MEYLKLFTDFLEDIEPLNEEECGRLFRAVLEYARTGSAPSLPGNERFVWPSARKQIDRSAQAYEAKVAGAAKARAKKADVSLMPLDIKPHQETSELMPVDKPQEKDKEKDKDNDKDEEKKRKKRDVLRHRYGLYKNVLLSDEEMRKLKAEFSDWEERIERVSEYVAKTGKSYKNFLAVIRSWARNDAERMEVKEAGDDWLDDWIKRDFENRKREAQT